MAAIHEINEAKGKQLFLLDWEAVNKVLSALNEATEWGQVFILDYVVNYNTEDIRQAERLIERVTPRLSHANPAVVLSAAKVILKFMDKINSQATLKSLQKKLSSSLISLVAGEPEITYVALKCFSVIA